MEIKRGNGTTKYGPGVDIELTGDEVALAIYLWLESQGAQVNGSRTVTVNGALCRYGRVYVDPSGEVRLSGRGSAVEMISK